MDLPLSLAQATKHECPTVPGQCCEAHTLYPKRHGADLLGKGPCRGRAHYRHNSLQQLHQQAFHFGQPPTAFHSRNTRPSPQTVVLWNPFPSQRERSESASPQLKFSALAFPPWLWRPALAWSRSQPQHRLGTRWCARRQTLDQLSLQPPSLCLWWDYSPLPPFLRRVPQSSSSFLCKDCSNPPSPNSAPNFHSEAHRKFWSTTTYSFNGLAVVIVTKLDGMLKS